MEQFLMQLWKMSENEDSAETDKNESKKGRFTVKFAIGRVDSISSDTATPAATQEPPSPGGKFFKKVRVALTQWKPHIL